MMEKVSLKQKIQREIEEDTKILRSDEPDSPSLQKERRLLFARIETLQWVRGLLDKATEEIEKVFAAELEDTKSSVRSHPFGTIETIRLRILNEILGVVGAEKQK